MSSHEETNGIRAVLILEVLGRPPKHLEETLENLIKQIDEEKGTVVKSKKISKAKKLEDQKEKLKNFDEKQMTSIEGFYTNFAEVEVEVEEITHLIILMFKYMPAHIEVISPELIALTNNGWGDILNELVRRLHGYDEIARVLQVERTMLENKLREVLGEKDLMKEMDEKKPMKKKSVKKKAGKKGK